MRLARFMRVFLSTALILAVGGWLAYFLDRPDGRFHIWFFDVGQGDAIFIQTEHGQQILIDGGPDDRVLVELGRVMPFWDRSIDLVIASHNHTDHLTGLVEVARRFQLGAVWLSGAIHTTPEYLAWVSELKERRIPTKVVSSGQQETIDTVGLRVLFPLTDQTGRRPSDQHDATVVVKASFQELSFLLTGDLNEGHETDLIGAHCPQVEGPALNLGTCPVLQSDILKVPHHGSRTGLAPAFLAAVQPSVAVISVGQKNRYGHPHEAILKRLKQASVQTLRTDQNGTIEITLDHGTIVVAPQRL